MNVLRICLAAILATTMVSACITPGQQRTKRLAQDVRDWNDDVRWARYDNAAMRLPSADAKRFLARVDLVEDDLMIADFDIKSIKIGDPDTRATVIVQFEWYTKSDPVIRKTTVLEKWEYHGGAWLVMAQERTRGDRFALVPEKPDDADEDSDEAPTSPDGSKSVDESSSTPTDTGGAN